MRVFDASFKVAIIVNSFPEENLGATYNNVMSLAREYDVWADSVGELRSMDATTKTEMRDYEFTPGQATPEKFGEFVATVCKMLYT